MRRQIRRRTMKIQIAINRVATIINVIDKWYEISIFIAIKADIKKPLLNVQRQTVKEENVIHLPLDPVIHTFSPSWPSATYPSI
jgi:hypothetical protein